MRVIKSYFFAAVFLMVGLGSCKKWDDSIAVTNQDLTMKLAAAIAADANLSKFNEYLVKVGVDVLLQSSKTYTVWAPNNAALQSLDPAIVNDTSKLRSFVLNHISNQSYFTGNVQISIRVPMLSGKYNNFFTSKLEDANIVAADRYLGNGALHVIDKAMLVLPNIWEYINSTASVYIQNNFVAGLNFTSFDPALATIDSISASTGQPVYRPGTGILIKNRFNDRVYDLRREDKQYTYFVIANPAFTLKSDSLKPYYKTASTVSTDSLAKWNIVKDLVFDTLYPTISSLPSTLTSKYGTVTPINQSQIIETRKLSNGIVYVLSTSGTNTAAKFPQIVIQGESPSGFALDRTGNTNYRVRRDPVTGLNYNDLLVSGHGVTGYYSFYRLNEVPTVKYNVYVRAVNDFQTANVFQSFAFSTFNSPSTFTPIITTPAALNHAVPLNTAAGAYNEVLLGSFTANAYGVLDVRLISGGTTLGSTGNAPIVLDYLRLVPAP